jgi:hypothetical protein
MRSGSSILAMTFSLPTALADSDLDREYALEPLGPRHRDVPRDRLLGTGGVTGAGAAARRRDGGAQRMTRSEHAVVAGQVRAGLWHQCNQ